VDENGEHVRPVAIHRAIYGSLERFIGVLIEHFAGAFSGLVRPGPGRRHPIADRHVEAGRELAGLLADRRLRAEVDGSDNRMQNKIRLAQEQKVPYMLVLGDSRRWRLRTVAIRNRRRRAGKRCWLGRIHRTAGGGDCRTKTLSHGVSGLGRAPNRRGRGSIHDPHLPAGVVVLTARVQLTCTSTA